MYKEPHAQILQLVHALGERPKNGGGLSHNKRADDDIALRHAKQFAHDDCRVAAPRRTRLRAGPDQFRIHVASACFSGRRVSVEQHRQMRRQDPVGLQPERSVDERLWRIRRLGERESREVASDTACSEGISQSSQGPGSHAGKKI
jgi:hypothetical protein